MSFLAPPTQQDWNCLLLVQGCRAWHELLTTRMHPRVPSHHALYDLRDGSDACSCGSEPLLRRACIAQWFSTYQLSER